MGDKEETGDTEPKRAKPGTRVLLPGVQAWNPPKSKAAASETTGRPPEVDQPQPAPEVSGPRARQALREGVIYWTGKLQEKQIIVIEGNQAGAGYAEGDLLPGDPVEVHVFSPAITIAGRPDAENGWNRIAFRCLETTKGNVTLNIQWRAGSRKFR